jgi:hypothetical protein
MEPCRISARIRAVQDAFPVPALSAQCTMTVAGPFGALKGQDRSYQTQYRPYVIVCARRVPLHRSESLEQTGFSSPINDARTKKGVSESGMAPHRQAKEEVIQGRCFFDSRRDANADA